jgi:hypothetical protein
MPTKNRVEMIEIVITPKYLPRTNSVLLIGFEINVNKVLLSSSSWIDPQLDIKLSVKLPKRIVEKQVSIANLNSSPKAKSEQSGENQIKKPKNRSKM